MINVKSIRSDAADQADPSDPLVVEKSEINPPRFLGAWLGGLIVLGVYLRSFLWSDASAAAELEDETPKADSDEGALTSSKSTLAAQEPAPEIKEPKEDIADQEAMAETTRFPQVLGRYESVFLEPYSVSSHGLEVPRVSANTLVPPFSSFGGIFTNRESNLSDAAPGSALPTESKVADRGNAPEETRNQESPDEPRDEAEEDRNRAPRNSGPVVIGDVGSGAVLAVSLSYFLAGTEYSDSDRLNVLMGDSESGVLMPKGDGWLYLADTEFLGEVKIAYTISDGEFSIEQTALLNVVENIFSGTDGDELIVGTRGRDQINGLDGDDNLAGLGGHDRVYGDGGDDNIAGGDGNDSLVGGDGDDLIVGGSGDDWISGDAGDDRLYGEDGDDTIEGGGGDDELHGGAGADLLSGGTGNDTIAGGTGADTVSGDAGDDVLSGDAGRDTLDGGEGNDTLSGGADADTLEGGAGDDVVVADDDCADDDYDGGEGYDRLDYSAASAAVDLDLIMGTATGESVGNDSFENFEHLVGSRGDDRFRAGAGDHELTGNGGANLYDFVQGDTVDIIRSMYQINDFDSDDRIWISSGSSQREIRGMQRSLEERIEDDLDDYADGLDVDEPRLTYHYDWTETYRRTVIEVDFDRDRVIDLELRLEGEHIIVVETI